MPVFIRREKKSHIVALFCILYSVIAYKKGSSMNQNLVNPMDGSCSSGYEVAMAYVPWQNFTRAYEPQRAWNTGTIFPELDKPFLGAGGKRR